MRLKSELYPKEQEEIANKIIDILDLDDKNSIILYDLDNDETKKKQLMDLIPSVRKFFAFNNIKSASDPEKDNLIKCHTLLRCKNGCGVWNRDCNGATNIRCIGYNVIHNVDRPSYLCRGT